MKKSSGIDNGSPLPLPLAVAEARRPPSSSSWSRAAVGPATAPMAANGGRAGRGAADRRPDEDDEEDSREVHRRNLKRKQLDCHGETLGGSSPGGGGAGGRNVRRRRRESFLPPAAGGTRRDESQEDEKPSLPLDGTHQWEGGSAFLGDEPPLPRLAPHDQVPTLRAATGNYSVSPGPVEDRPRVAAAAAAAAAAQAGAAALLAVPPPPPGGGFPPPLAQLKAGDEALQFRGRAGAPPAPYPRPGSLSTDVEEEDLGGDDDVDDADPNRPCRVIQFVTIVGFRPAEEAGRLPRRLPSRWRGGGGVGGNNNNNNNSNVAVVVGASTWCGRVARAGAEGKRGRLDGASSSAAAEEDSSTDDDSTSSTSTSSSTTSSSSSQDGEASSVASDLTTDPRLFAAAPVSAAALEADGGYVLDDDDDMDPGQRGHYRFNLPPELAWKALVVLSILIILLDFVWSTVSNAVIRVVYRPRRKEPAPAPALAPAPAAATH